MTLSKRKEAHTAKLTDSFLSLNLEKSTSLILAC